MSNILVINGAKQFAHSNGELNDTLTTLATNHLTELGHEVQVTLVQIATTMLKPK